MLMTPLVLGFSIIILSEIISLGYLIIPWILTLLAGVFWSNMKSLKLTRTLSVISLIIIAFFINFNFIPHLLRSVLSKELNEPGFNFEISRLDSSIISSSEFKGKTIVVDFFGTWCGPCILELSEMEKVKSHFKNEGNLLFLIVNSDQPGDSPEKTRQFKINHGFDFDFFYDHGGSAHKSFGLNGVPSLVIIDKDGNIRFKKQGYNKSEGNFKEYMIKFIDKILK